jgi:hypothetical protein
MQLLIESCFTAGYLRLCNHPTVDHINGSNIVSCPGTREKEAAQVEAIPKESEDSHMATREVWTQPGRDRDMMEGLPCAAMFHSVRHYLRAQTPNLAIAHLHLADLYAAASRVPRLAVVIPWVCDIIWDGWP